MKTKQIILVGLLLAAALALIKFGPLAWLFTQARIPYLCAL